MKQFCFFGTHNSKSVDFSHTDIYLRSKYNLFLDHTNYVLCRCLKIYNRDMLTRSLQKIFNPMRSTVHFVLIIFFLTWQTDTSPPNSTSKPYTSYLPLYFIFIINLNRFTLPDFPSMSVQAFSSCCHRKTSTITSVCISYPHLRDLGQVIERSIGENKASLGLRVKEK